MSVAPARGGRPAAAEDEEDEDEAKGNAAMLRSRSGRVYAGKVGVRACGSVARYDFDGEVEGGGGGRGDFVRSAVRVAGVRSKVGVDVVVVVVGEGDDGESGRQLHAMCFACSVEVIAACGAGRCGMLRGCAWRVTVWCVPSGKGVWERVRP